VEVAVDLEGVAAVEPGLEQHGLPEVGEDGEMFGQVQVRDVEEHRTEQVISEGLGVEGDE